MNPKPTMVEAQPSKTTESSCCGKFLQWIDKRFPLSSLWQAHMSHYYAPKNFNVWYFFGVFSIIVLGIQLITGIFLVMHYKPDATLNASGIPVAFASVEYIMREVPWGKLIRYLHSTGASAFFIVVYIHMFRGMIYGSYRAPRELVWIFGCLIFLCLMAEAFFGYLLPWGQMSFWGAQVIINLFDAIPIIGKELSIWIRGDYVISDATLNRFFAFHVIAIPFALVGLVVAHIVALHEVGSNNPDGIEIKEKKDEHGHPLDGIPFHPYYTVHDLFGASMFFFVFLAFVFFAPEGGGYLLEYNNFIPADALKTPTHIAPVWYFTPFYSMLRATTDSFVHFLIWIIGITATISIVLAYFLQARKIATALLITTVVVIGMLLTLDAKFWGVVIMVSSVLILFFLPWLDYSPVKSLRYRPNWQKWFYALFVINFLILGYLGINPPSEIGGFISKVGTFFYFAFFLLMPIWSQLGEVKPLPDRVRYQAH